MDCDQKNLKAAIQSHESYRHSIRRVAKKGQGIGMGWMNPLVPGVSANLDFSCISQYPHNEEMEEVGSMVSGLDGALSTQALVAQLLQAAVAQSLEPATDIALLNLQLNAGGGNPEGVGNLLDVIA
jgi:hypothetical protein